MKLAKVEFLIRTPTVQYGYVEGRYTLEAEDDSPEEIESQIQFYMAVQEHSIEQREKAIAKEKSRANDELWDDRTKEYIGNQ